MKANKGIVISINDDSITLLGNDGVFYSVAHPHHVPLLGEELPIPVQSAGKHTSRTSHWFSAKHMKRWGLVASICLLILTTVMFFPREVDASYIVALDINPSVEIYLDKEYKVIKVVPITNDATALLQPLKLKGKELSNAIKEITTQAKVEGYLPQTVEKVMVEKQVVATVVRLDASVDDATLFTQVQQQLSTVEDEEILIRSTSMETLEQAHKEQLPVYKYEVVRTIESKGIDVDQKVIQSLSAGELVEKFNIDPQKIEDFSKSKNNNKPNKESQNTKKEEKEAEKNKKELEKEEKKQEQNNQKEEKQQNKKDKEDKQKKDEESLETISSDVDNNKQPDDDNKKQNHSDSNKQNEDKKEKNDDVAKIEDKQNDNNGNKDKNKNDKDNNKSNSGKKDNDNKGNDKNQKSDDKDNKNNKDNKNDKGNNKNDKSNNKYGFKKENNR